MKVVTTGNVNSVLSCSNPNDFASSLHLNIQFGRRVRRISTLAKYTAIELIKQCIQQLEIFYCVTLFIKVNKE